MLQEKTNPELAVMCLKLLFIAGNSGEIEGCAVFAAVLEKIKPCFVGYQSKAFKIQKLIMPSC